MNKKILFLCTGNSCRSQMAEGWAKTLLAASGVEAFSAGVEKHGLNPLAVEVMAEAGVDISAQESKLVEELGEKDFDLVVTLCGHARESCPAFPGRVIHAAFPDPPRLAENAATRDEELACYRRVRDNIRKFVESLPEFFRNRKTGGRG